MVRARHPRLSRYHDMGRLPRINQLQRPHQMKTLLIIALALSLTSCGYVDQVVDTRGAVATAPDSDLDGIPDEITVPSDQVRPVLNDNALDKINGELTDIIIHATK